MQRSRMFKRFALTFLVLFFVLFSNWLASRASSVELPSSSEKTLIYSNQTGDDLHLLFCETLAGAKKSIFLEMYAITDPAILTILKNQTNAGKQITIHADKKASPGLKKKIPVDLHDGKGLMHRKVIVLDDELVLLGSTNFTSTSLKRHDNIVVAIQNNDLARFCKNSQPPWIYSNPEMTIWKLPESGKDALEASCDLLSSAERTIRVAMFTFTHMRLAHELVKAKNRGVDVIVALDHYTREGSSKKVADFLRAQGIPVYVSQGMQLLHHKWALIDEDILLAGSANWTKSAFEKNKDVLFSLHLKGPLKDKMRRLWHEIQLTSAL